MISRLIFAIAVLAAATISDVPASLAYGDAPWCAVLDLGTGNVVWECYYRSAEECAPHVVAGNRGFCNVNPYSGGTGAMRPHQKHRQWY